MRGLFVLDHVEPAFGYGDDVVDGVARWVRVPERVVDGLSADSAGWFVAGDDPPVAVADGGAALSQVFPFPCIRAYPRVSSWGMNLESERVVVSAPMSFAGAWRRTRNALQQWWLFWTLGIVVVAAWWLAVACWYVVFGVLLVPYRLVRRGSRQRKRQELQHREMLGRLG